MSKKSAPRRVAETEAWAFSLVFGLQAARTKAAATAVYAIVSSQDRTGP